MNDFFDRFELAIMSVVGIFGFVVVILDLFVWRPF